MKFDLSEAILILIVVLLALNIVQAFLFALRERAVIARNQRIVEEEIDTLKRDCREWKRACQEWKDLFVKSSPVSGILMGFNGIQVVSPDMYAKLVSAEDNKTAET